MTPPETREPFVITGRLEYIDGDRLLVDCGRTEPCKENLVRDERLQAEVFELQGKQLTLRVERVAICGPRSSQVVCYQGVGPTALLILEWLRVE